MRGAVLFACCVALASAAVLPPSAHEDFLMKLFRVRSRGGPPQPPHREGGARPPSSTRLGCPHAPLPLRPATPLVRWWTPTTTTASCPTRS